MKLSLMTWASSALVCAVLTISTTSVVSGSPFQISVKEWKKPAFCRSLDCPRWIVKETTDDYEVRELEAADYVYTNVTGLGYALASAKGFARLFQYISGANEDKQKIEMTTPVTVTFLPTDNYQKAINNHTVAFYIPHELQGEAPKPSNDEVGILHYPAQTTYAASFAGFATQGSILSAAAKLRDALRLAEVDVDEKAFWFATYDAPTQLTDRHNEVGFDVPVGGDDDRSLLRGTALEAAPAARMADLSNVVEMLRQRLSALLG